LTYKFSAFAIAKLFSFRCWGEPRSIFSMFRNKKNWLLTLGMIYWKYSNNYSRVKPEHINEVELETLYAEWIEHLPNQYCKTTFLALHTYLT